MQEFFNIQYENNKIISFYTEMALFICREKFNIKKINFLQSFQSTLYLVTEKNENRGKCNNDSRTY